jgi:ABC-type sugar transport system permease subunit
MLTFIAYPLVQSLILSLYEWNGITAPRFVGLTNFKLLLQDSSLWTALINTIAFSILTTIGTVSIGFLLAVAVERRVKGWAFFKVIYFLPVMISTTVVGLLWGQLYDHLWPDQSVAKSRRHRQPADLDGRSQRGLVRHYRRDHLAVFGVPHDRLPGRDGERPPGPARCGHHRWCQRLAAYHSSHLPMVKQVVAVIVMLQIIFSLKVFDIVWVMTQGGPGESTTVLGVYLYRNAFIYTYFGYGSTVAVLMTFIIFSLSIIYQRVVRPERIEY